MAGETGILACTVIGVSYFRCALVHHEQPGVANPALVALLGMQPSVEEYLSHLSAVEHQLFVHRHSACEHCRKQSKGDTGKKHQETSH
jgi:hypothetical protein